MDLWNEYEGRSVAGVFPLERLIRPEGRSAFFSTSSSGTSTVIRLIESHFDEEEILARWTGVSDLHQPNLLTLTRFGQAMMDETSLLYVVLEPTEADLSQILCERPLTLAETRQVAASLIPALQALHESGFIHEHIQPANVLAVGEVVKLRSDCIREAPEGPEGDSMRARDVHDLAILLLECLTQQRNQAISPAAMPPPVPFREIIDNGISGTWNLARMIAALDATTSQPMATHEAFSSEVPTGHNQQVSYREEATASATRTQPGAVNGGGVVPNELHRQPSDASLPRRFPEAVNGRIRLAAGRQSRSPQLRVVLLALGVFCLIVLAAYVLMHGRGKKDQAVSEAASQVSSSGTTKSSASHASASTPTVPLARITPAQGVPPTISTSRDEWRVVVFTYNRQSEASGKVRALEQRFASLHPAIFTPTGRAPCLVTLGGPLTRDAAFTLRNKLRKAGLPRDIYAQNYSSKSH